jgi:hypothetical protein
MGDRLQASDSLLHSNNQLSRSLSRSAVDEHNRY